LIKISAAEHVLIVAAAHLIADGVSMSIYEKELAHAYNSLVNKKPVTLPTLDINFADYVAWQKRQLETGLLDSVKAYWQQQLNGFTPTDATILPFTDLSGSENDDDFDLEAKYYYYQFSDKLNEAIRKYAGSVNKTIFSIVMTGFLLCLYRESGKNDIGLLAFFANRTCPETENIIGMFATGNVVRVKVHADDSFNKCIAAVSESLDGAVKNQELIVPPLDTRVPKSLCNQLTYRSITCELLADDEVASFSGLQVEREILGRDKSEYALRSFVIDSRERLSFMFQYNLDLFDIEDIKRLAARTETILEEIIENPSAVISSVDL
jgi:polyketide synthase PksJ